MRCTACDSRAPDGSRFCPSCGRPLVGISPLPDETRLVDAETNALDAARSGDGSGTRMRTLAAPPHTDVTALAPGTSLADRYRIARPLGRGGMGVVYQADDLRLEHGVALKFLPAALAEDRRRLEQFHAEVRVARQISHPNVCRVYDIGDVDGQLFLSMEYIDGQDLSAMLRRRGPLPEPEAVELMRQICAGLAAVHAEGVLHRDLKPPNIMIPADGQALLMDFGIAVAGDRDHPGRLTEGTPAYMAPEQLDGGRVSVQSDLSALGAVMYEMVAGRRLFQAATLEDLIQQQGSLTATTAQLSGISARLRETISCAWIRSRRAGRRARRRSSGCCRRCCWRPRRAAGASSRSSPSSCSYRC